MYPTTARLAEAIGQPLDLVIRPVPSGPLALLYLTSLIDADRVEQRLLGTLLAAGPAPRGENDLLSWFHQHAQIGDVARVDGLEQAAEALADGKAVIAVEWLPEWVPEGPAAVPYFVADVPGNEHRKPEEPATETVIRGSRDGFTETIQVSLGQIRSRLRDPQLRVEEMRVGRRGRTKLAFLYHAEFASPAVVAEVKERIQAVKIDALVESGQLEQWIEDSPWSPYPQIQTTERPDKVVAALLEGRVAILLEGTPFALIVPAVMVSFFQSVEDYSQRWLSGTALRFVRIGAVAMASLAPSFYVAMTRFNPELMPLKMALSLAASREGIPFPIVVEALLMEAMVELLREAGNRMPKPLGQALGIVGGLVIGDMAVRAGLVSPIMVIVVGLTALGAFAIPSYEAALPTRMIRFPMVIVTGMFGITGLLTFILVIIAHLCTVRSFGVPYLTPLAQLTYREWFDTIVRAPVRYLLRRPSTYSGYVGKRGQSR